jgi:hypothetical protein
MRNVYNWNSGIKGSGEVNDKWMKEIVFFGMIVIPVYMFSALLDAFVFNAIQFWSGSNPVKLTKGPNGFPVEIRAGDTTIDLSWSADRQSARLVYRRNGDPMKTVTLTAEGRVYRMFDEQTGASYVFERGAGDMRIVDQACRVLVRVPVKDLEFPMSVMGNEAGSPA